MKIRHILALTLVFLTVFCLTLPALAATPIEITGPGVSKSGYNDVKDSATAVPSTSFYKCMCKFQTTMSSILYFQR
jgi:hypothetical protein